jgi:hypothetical protein
MIDQLTSMGPKILLVWVFASLFAATLLAMACTTLRVPGALRPFVVATIVAVACWYLEAPLLLIPVIALFTAIVARVVGGIVFRQGVTIVGPDWHSVDYSAVKGGPVERLRGEVAAIRKALPGDRRPIVQARVITAPDSGPARRGIIVVTSRW